MLVETYEVPESGEAGITESDAAAVALIEALGLDGQKELINPEAPTERMPYRRMTEQEDFVYKVLLPVRTGVGKYMSGAIPLRVLQVISHAREGNYFHEMEVWHPKDARIDDPILVGVRKEGQYGSRTLYLLARWGEVLTAFSELLVEAGAKWRDEAAAQCKKAIREAELELRVLESLTPEQAANADRSPYNTSGPSYSGVLA